MSGEWPIRGFQTTAGNVISASDDELRLVSAELAARRIDSRSAAELANLGVSLHMARLGKP
jgi:hypothetical protein